MEEGGESEGKEPPTMPIPSVQNVVSTAKLGCKLNLDIIATKTGDSKYVPCSSTYATVRIKKTKTTARLYASGILVCIGAKTEEESRMAAQKYEKMVRKLGFRVTMTDFKVINVTASADVGFRIRLELLAYSPSFPCATYEPEIFPGLLYQMKNSNATVIVFASGKIVICGMKNREGIDEVFQSVYPIILGFRT